MSEFKNLNLDRTKIDQTIEQFPEAKIENKKVTKTRTQINYIINVNGKQVLLSVYFNRNGTTSINPSVGKNPDISKQIAFFLKKKLTISEQKNVSFCSDEIDHNDFNCLIEYLREECKINVNMKENNNNVLYRLESKYDDKMNIHRYKNGNTLFQGKPLYIFSEIRHFLSTVLDIDSILDIDRKVYKINIDVDDVVKELRCKLLNSYDYLYDITKKMLASSLTLRRLDVNLDDYSPFVFPALRAVEGYIKQLFADNGIIVSKTGFSQFEKIDCRYKLTLEYRRQIPSQSTCCAIEQCYNFYHKHRHSLFHTDIIPEASRIIEKKEEADRLIKSAFKLIEDTYNEIIFAKKE